jgi:hypothetical protein
MTVPNIPQRHLQLFRVFPRITANWHNNVSIRRRELFQKERFHKHRDKMVSAMAIRNRRDAGRGCVDLTAVESINVAELTSMYAAISWGIVAGLKVQV